MLSALGHCFTGSYLYVQGARDLRYCFRDVHIRPRHGPSNGARCGFFNRLLDCQFSDTTSAHREFDNELCACESANGLDAVLCHKR